MSITARWQRLPVAQAALWLVLVAISIYTYAKFFVAPFAGLNFNPDGRIVKVYTSADPQAALREQDRLIQVGPLLWSDFQNDLRRPLFPGALPGQVIPLIVERDGQQLTLPWVFPGPSPEERFERLNSDWFLPFLFWLAAALTIFLLRSKDGRWWLLLAFNLLTALWLGLAGRTSATHVWYSAVLLRVFVWLSVPVYLHLH